MKHLLGPRALSQIFARLTLPVVVFLLGSSAVRAENSDHYYRFAVPQEDKEVHDSSFVDPIQLFKKVQTSERIQKALSLLSWKKIGSPPSSPTEPYHRPTHFGSWKQTSSTSSCLDTRNRVLVRDSLEPVIFQRDKKCRVEQGLWFDPTTEQYFDWAQDLQVDHFVPLKHAYQTGAFTWKKSRRCHYTNFLKMEEHLLPIDKFENLRKGSRSPEKYLPKTEFRCEYLARWLKIKMSWDLIITAQEATAIRNEIQSLGCTLGLFRFTKKDLQKWITWAADVPATCLKEDQIQR